LRLYTYLDTLRRRCLIIEILVKSDDLSSAEYKMETRDDVKRRLWSYPDGIN